MARLGPSTYAMVCEVVVPDLGAEDVSKQHCNVLGLSVCDGLSSPVLHAVAAIVRSALLGLALNLILGPRISKSASSL